MGRITYKEIAKRRIKDKRNVVISEAFDEEGSLVGYSIAEQLVTEEEGKETKVFLRGGLGIVSGDGLMEMKRAIDTACTKVGLIGLI